MIAIATTAVAAWTVLLVSVAKAGSTSNAMGSHVERALAGDEVLRNDVRDEIVAIAA